MLKKVTHLHNIVAIAVPGRLEISLLDDIRVVYESSTSRKGGMASIQRGSLTSKQLTELHGDIEIAIKFFTNSKLTDEEISETFLFETAIMASLPVSPNIIQLIGFSTMAKAIVMPYYEQNLSSYVRQSTCRLPRSKILKIASDIASGMQLIHDQAKLLHLDLKPRKYSAKFVFTILSENSSEYTRQFGPWQSYLCNL